jgi:hypothetical protein
MKYYAGVYLPTYSDKVELLIFRTLKLETFDTLIEAELRLNQFLEDNEHKVSSELAKECRIYIPIIRLHGESK